MPKLEGIFRLLALWVIFWVQQAWVMSEEPVRDERPNVVLIFADDQGSLDLNCYGAEDLFTPNLDALANGGVRFTQFYSASSVCSPSRASLLTGRFPGRVGVENNVPSQLGHPGLPTEEVTIPEILAPEGYATAAFGKWHLGTTDECRPPAQGFDEYLGHLAGCIDNYSHFFYWEGPNNHNLFRNGQEYHEDGVHMSEIITREATRFIETHSDEPFFLYLPWNLPHYPTQAPAEFREMYKDVPEPRQSYAAVVSYLDDAVGRVLKTLEKEGLAENTIVIFLSDNGHSTEERANWGGGYAGPYRGQKFSFFEAGVRMPCVIRWPGHTEPGRVIGQMGSTMDLYPTIAEVCGAELPADRVYDGISLVDVLESDSAKLPVRNMYWQLGDEWAVRSGDWKLLFNAKDMDGHKHIVVKGVDGFFLSNLASDLGEKINFASEQPERVEEMTKLYKAWRKDLGLGE